MKKLIRICAILSAFVSVPAWASSPGFNQLVSFGDSLSDMGNSSLAPISAGGSTWLYYLGEQLGLNISPSSQGGQNYAFVNAMTGTLPYTPSYDHGETPPPTLLQQIEQEYLASHGERANPDALYTIDAGTNDLVNTHGAFDYFKKNELNFSQAALDLMNASTNNILTAVNILHNAGAQFIIVANIPDIANIPMGYIALQALEQALKKYLTPQQIQQLYNIASIYNSILLAKLNASGLNIIQLDTYNFFNAIQQNYNLFGFLGAYSIYNGQGNPDQYIFDKDGFHPTAAVHHIFAEYTGEVLMGPMYAAALAHAPFAIIDAQNSMIRAQIDPLEQGYSNLPIGKFTSFAAGDYNTEKTDQPSIWQPGYTSQNKAFTVGGTYRFNTNGLVGFAVGRSMGDVAYAHQAGGFDMDENLVTAFGGYVWNHWYGNAQLNYGNLDYSHIKRNFMLGILPETVTGQTTGEQYGVAGLLGYNFNLMQKQLNTGPVATIDWQRVIVNPYAETSSHFSQTASGGAFDALQYQRQEHDSLLGGLGWQFHWQTQWNDTQVIPYLQATYNHPFNNLDSEAGTEKVYAGVTTLPGSKFYIPVVAENKDFGLIDAGVQSVFDNGLILSFNYNTMLGEPNQHSQNFMISASMPV